jgi:putative ABC transport system substrate-binding protein
MLFAFCQSVDAQQSRILSVGLVSLGSTVTPEVKGLRDGLKIAEFGALLYYGADTYRLGQRGAWYVDRILKGAKPQDLPVELPSYFEMIVNLNTAKQIGLTIPPNVLARADRVIR